MRRNVHAAILMIQGSMLRGLRDRLRSLFARPTAARAHRYSDAELLARTEEFNQNADAYWRAVTTLESGRRHVLNRPFAGPTAGVDIYRLGLMMTELRLGPGLDVLDFGAGSCWLTSCLNRMGCRVVAVEISQAALELGRELFSIDQRHRKDLPPRLLTYDGHRLPLEDGSVDRIACYDAFHHVPNQDELLREMNRVLRSGGRMVMAEPGEGHSHASGSIFEESTFSVLENDIDVMDVERRARAAGFSDIRIKPYFDPAVDNISPSEFAGLAGLERAPRLSTLRAGVRVFGALRKSLQKCFVIILTKGIEVRDSRSPGLLRAEIRLLEQAPLRGQGGVVLQTRARLKNVGDTFWRGRPDPAGGSVLLGSHLFDAGGQPLRMDYLRAPLPRDVEPGAEIDVMLPVRFPSEAGRYTLRLDPVAEHVIWFSQAGSPPLDVALEVVQSETAPAYQCVMSLPNGKLSPLPAGSRIHTRLTLRNVGSASWAIANAPGPGALRVGAQLLDVNGQVVDKDYARAELPREVKPGDACDVPLEFRLPPTPGRYAVKVDLLLEQVSWFEERGSQPLTIEKRRTNLRTAPPRVSCGQGLSFSSRGQQPSRRRQATPSRSTCGQQILETPSGGTRRMAPEDRSASGPCS